MINISKLISSIKIETGLMSMATPFENLDELIREIIVIRTIPVFNELYPYKVPLNIDTNELEVIERRVDSTVYQLPDVFGDAEVMMISGIEPTYDDYVSSNIYSYESSVFSYGFPCYCSYQDMILAQANSNLMSSASKGITVNFIPPNMVEIFNSYGMSNNFRLTVCLSHSENLTTIPSTCYTSFLKLAALDVKVYLYNTLIHYDQLQTAYGQLNLNLDRWSGAEDDRRTLIEKWEQTYHLDLTEYMYF